MAYWLTIELEHGKIAPLPATMDTEAAGLVYGTTVPQLLTQLDRITQELGVERIDRFIYKDSHGYKKLLQEAESEGNAVLASAMRAEIDTLAAQPRWHEPAAAKQTIHSLQEFLATNPHILPGKDPQATAKWTLWDLEAYDRILTEIEQQGTRFAFVERQDLN
jgi:chromosome condensin MukBEF complex kleisin-like MukF subunit